MNYITVILHFCAWLMLVSSEGMKGSFESCTELDQMRDQMSQMQRFMVNQADQVKRLRDEMINQDKKFEQQSEELSLQGRRIQMLEKENDHLKSEQTTGNNHVHELRQSQAIGIYTAVGCVTDILSLQCHNGGIINVTDAFYGQNYFVCSTGCCGPHPSLDCKELVSENEPGDWAVLLYLCNNKTQCEYDYSGSLVQTCDENYVADYMEIRYSCIGEEVQSPVGFSAYATVFSLYNVGMVLRYDAIESNYGGFYSPTSHIFTCPLHGVYMFSATGYTDNLHYLNVVVKIDGNNLTNFFSDDGVDAWLTSSAFVITSCNAGQQVWVECRVSSSYVAADFRLNTFSGYLLHIF